MEKPKPIITSFSLPHLLSVPPLQHSADTNYYVGLFEFPQGSSPKILWDNKGKSVTNRQEFLLFVVNIPTNIRDNFNDPKPTIIKSEYMNATFLGVYVQIPDIQARGFSRSIVLVIAHQDSRMIGYIYSKLLDDFVSFAIELQTNASEIFPDDLMQYAASLQETVKKNPESRQLLASKMEELNQILKRMGINEITTTNAQEQPPEYFTQINNDLRSILTLTHFRDVKNDIILFVDSLPIDLLQCNAMWKAQNCLLNVINASHDDLASEFQILFKNKRIFDCLYSLYTGHSLYILSSKPGLGTSVGEKIVSLSPFETILPLCTVDTRMKDPCVILTGEFDPSKHPNDSCLDLDNDKYYGSRCPLESILYKELPKVENHSTSLLMMMFSNDLKRIGSRFIRKTIEMSARAPQTRQRMDAQMKSIGFTEYDTPLIEYWSVLLSQQDNVDSSSLSCYLNK